MFIVQPFRKKEKKEDILLFFLLFLSLPSDANPPPKKNMNIKRRRPLKATNGIFDNCQRPVFSFGVSQQITNL